MIKNVALIFLEEILVQNSMFNFQTDLKVCVKIDIEGEGEKRGKEGRERIQLSNKWGREGGRG